MEEQLLSLGQRTAVERVAALILDLYGRAEARDMVRGDGMPFPLTQQHIADALGNSLVHANRTLKRLQRDGLFPDQGTAATGPGCGGAGKGWRRSRRPERRASIPPPSAAGGT